MRKNWNISRDPTGVDRAIREQPEYETLWLRLMKITAATQIGSSTLKRWRYTVVEATFNTAALDYVGLTTSNPATDYAISISELSNTVGTGPFSYGVNGPFPGTFEPQQIPVGTYVLCYPHRNQGGDLVYVIINTQAIDGACTALEDLTDGGLYTGEDPN